MLAFGKGGLLETLLAGRTGVFFTAQTPDELNEAAALAERTDWDPAAIRAHAETFGEARFLEGLRAEIAAALEGRRT